VLVHGSSGVGSHVDRWAEELRQVGAATFVLDSFTGRDISGTAQDQAQINHLAPIVDTYRALELLATHPRIDPTRITLMGFSRGGTVALWAALTRFQRLHGLAGARFAHHIAFYPGCYFRYVDDEAVTDRPIRIFHGTADDYTPVEPCRGYVERLRRAGKDAQITEYPGAHHGFDRASAAPPFRIHGAQTARHCFWEERPEGHLVNRESGLPFSVGDPCVVRGTTLGPDPAAYRQALQAVKALVGKQARPRP
jgi:dienelactone hydrolase